MRDRPTPESATKRNHREGCTDHDSDVGLDWCPFPATGSPVSIGVTALPKGAKVTIKKIENR